MKFDYKYIKEFIEKEGYELITDEYVDIKQKLETICPNGHIYYTSFKNFKSGRRCPECRKTSYENVKHKCDENNYKLITKKDEYVNARTPVTVMCKHGHVSNKRYDNLTQGCKKCQDNDKKNNYNMVKEFIENNGYVLLDNSYVNNTTFMTVVCSNGHKYKTTFSNFKSGARCKNCAIDSYRNDIEYVRGYIKSKGYEMLSDYYDNYNTKILLRCQNGHEYLTTFSLFKYSEYGGCSSSNISIGENKINEFLSYNKIEYKVQYKFKDCVDKRELPFDFYIPKLNLLIEFDGQQHYKNKFGEDNFYNTIYHDAIKNSYCEDNHIKLLRIPYWEYRNIEHILTQNILNLE